jgi:tetratricopeptide (TPR) repeat protein/tRNA A-37 threonylcarbamoyl transferase component Bud32/TolB-like protein
MTTPLEDLRAALAGRYEIDKEIGQGGMATVYLADDLRHERKVAVKVLRPDLAAALGAERFLREIKIAANLTHPHILPLHDSGEAGGFLYYVMPYIEGDTLRDRIEREGALPVSEAVRIIREVIDALALAHSQGVVHRDIKPDNVMLSGRHAMVMDFGVAKAVSEATGRNAITTVGVALGTPTYMAPEQATADPNVDHRADIYAVGVMAYELLAGRTPFQGATPQAVLAAHVTEEPDPVSKHRDQVSVDLEALVMKCLAKRPADRWQSADEMLPHLEALATSSGGLTPTATRPVAAASAPSPARRLAVPIAIGAVAVVAALWFGWLRPTSTPVDVVATRLAVFPFPVTGAADDTGYLREGLVHLLSTALDGAGDVRAIDPQTVLSATGDDDLDVERAREAADRVGAGMFIMGSVTQVGAGRIQVTGSMYLGDDPDPIVARATGSPDDVLELTGNLARQLLAGYSATQPARIDSLALLTTESVEALKAYLRGMDQYRKSRWASAQEAFETAVAIDSTFALAYYRISRAASWAERHEEGVAAAETAIRLADRLSPRHRDLLQASLALERGRPEEAERHALNVARSYPEEFDGWYLLGEARLHFGPFMGRPFLEAKDPFDRAVAIDPGRGDAFGHAYDLSLASRDIEEVENLFRLRGAMNQPQGSDSAAESVPRELRIARLLAEGGESTSDSIVALLTDTRGTLSMYWAARTGIWWGHIPTGSALMTRVAETGATPLERAMGRRFLAMLELQQGRKDAAQRQWEASAGANRAEAIVQSAFSVSLAFPPVSEMALRSWRDTLVGWDPAGVPPCADADATGFLCPHVGDYGILKEFFLGIIAARLGDVEGALRHTAVVQDWQPAADDPYLPADLAHGMRALIAQLDGRNEDALAELRLVSRERGTVKVRASGIYKMAQQHFLHAEVLNEMGRYEEAMQLYTAAADASPPLAPASHLRIGEIHEQRGDVDQAVERYSAFVDMWAEADPEYQPMVEDVRNRIAVLVGEPTP